MSPRSANRMLKLTLNPFLGEKHIWDYLFGLPLNDKWKHFDMYGEWDHDNTRSYHMTGKFGFRGTWHCGRTPDWKLKETTAFADEDCDNKEKWKRMIIWNHFYEHDDEKLRNILQTTKSERARHVITELLKLENRLASSRSRLRPPHKKTRNNHTHTPENQTHLIKEASP